MRVVGAQEGKETGVEVSTILHGPSCFQGTAKASQRFGGALERLFFAANVIFAI